MNIVFCFVDTYNFLNCRSDKRSGEWTYLHLLLSYSEFRKACFLYLQTTYMFPVLVLEYPFHFSPTHFSVYSEIVTLSKCHCNTARFVCFKSSCPTTNLGLLSTALKRIIIC